jgi:hypothetical protein
MSGYVRAHFTKSIASFQPDILLLSTDDPAEVPLRTALALRHAKCLSRSL